MFIIFNLNKSKTKNQPYQDKWQGNLKLNQTVLRQVQKIKYLGYIITDNLKNDGHIQNRIELKNKSFGKLTALSFTSELYHPMLKAQMIIRQVLAYGLENVFLTKTNYNRFKRHEGLY